MLKQVISTIGKHKIPRFIYHMTSKQNYEKMLRSGNIKMTEDLLCGNAIFTSDLNNLFKRGLQPVEDTTLIESLLQQVNTCENKIVLLRIPTAAIDKKKLFVRNHKAVCDFCFSKEVVAADNALRAECNANKRNWNTYVSELRKIYDNELRKLDNQSVVDHLCSGEPAEMANLYKQRKQAFEYIYRDNIPISVVEKIGECECNIEEAKQTFKYPIRSIFSSLLKDTPEHNATILLNC